MDRMEILKDYISYCYDTKKDARKKENRKKFVNAYIKNRVEYYGIENIENIQKEVENILKYNPLTIAKLFEDHKKDVESLPF